MADGARLIFAQRGRIAGLAQSRTMRDLSMDALGVGALAGILAAVIFWRVHDRPGAPEFTPVLLWQLAVWAPWIPLASAVRRLSARLPVAAVGKSRRLVLHATTSLVAASVHLVWYFLVSDAISPYHGLPGTKYGAYAWFFIFWFLLDLALYWALHAFARGSMLARESGGLASRIAELEEALAERRSTDAPRAFAVRKNGRRHLVPIGDVHWIEAQDYYAALHTATGTFLLRESLATLAGRLDDRRFIRVHRSTIANLSQLQSLEVDAGGVWHITMADGTRRRVSRAGRRLLRGRIAGAA